MEKELALFPLNLVVFPGEYLNLHIFEPRYKQLVNDCLGHKSTFGIPSFVHNKIEYGTEVEILEVSKTYADGKMDIKTRGLDAFEVEDFQNPWKDRLYAGGRVRMRPETIKEDPELAIRITDLAQQLFSWLKMEGEIEVKQSTPLHTFVHKVGLKLEEEYELLKMGSDNQRKHYVINHIREILPVLERAERAKERISLNGHFKNMDPLKF